METMTDMEEIETDIQLIEIDTPEDTAVGMILMIDSRRDMVAREVEGTEPVTTTATVALDSA